MGRTPSYKPAEDAIILTTSGMPAEETNARLVAAGFEERSPNALKQRRYYLRRNEVGPGGDDGHASVLSATLARRRVLTLQLEQNAAEREQIEQHITAVNAEIRRLLGAVQEELAAEEEAASHRP